MGDKFCAPSVSYEVGKDKFTTINSWSNQSISKVGYESIGTNIDVTLTSEDAEDTEIEEATDFFAEIELELKDEFHSSKDRNHTAIVLPARNFLSNAEFKTTGLQLPHWDVFEGALVEETEKEEVSKKTHT